MGTGSTCCSNSLATVPGLLRGVLLLYTGGGGVVDGMEHLHRLLILPL